MHDPGRIADFGLEMASGNGGTRNTSSRADLLVFEPVGSSNSTPIWAHIGAGERAKFGVMVSIFRYVEATSDRGTIAQTEEEL